MVFNSPPVLHDCGCFYCKAELASLREENARLRAEVKRLEGLILDWESSDVVSRIDSEDALWAEAKRIRGNK